MMMRMMKKNKRLINGQSLVQETTPLQTSGSIYNVEKAVVSGKTYYKIAISKGTTIGKFQQVGKTFITDSSPIGSTVLNVDSTIGFGATGTISFENKLISNEPTHKRTALGISHVLERRRVFPHLTVYQNLVLGAWHPLAKEVLESSLAKVFSKDPISKVIFEISNKRVGATAVFTDGDHEIIGIITNLQLTHQGLFSK